MVMQLIELCHDHTPEQLLQLPAVRERAALYAEHAEQAEEQIVRCGERHGNLLVLDLRGEETIWPTNRFTVYALFPEVNISVHVMWGVGKLNTVFAIGKSVLDRSSATNVGELALKYGGGGHEAAGTCQVEHENSEKVLRELIDRITGDG